ncbi:hypothetical protein E2C01_027910 [Portunus trituberculatus]|uniref:Uncharacterized protein n=1 Tax=Portunus trituberculatus TaxID=210409 RepID=A0A5B7EMG3_PORTR|nr:hypothetical protein [Portunus trituberculatus]
MVVGAGMGGLGLMILFVGCLSTGDTRNRVYRTWRGRVGGRISCAIIIVGKLSRIDLVYESWAYAYSNTHYDTFKET